MKKRNILRASGALLIFAVLGLFSACDVFTLYEPVGRFSSLDKDRISLSVNGEEEITVTVYISSKIEEPYIVVWVFSDAGIAKVSKVTRNDEEVYTEANSFSQVNINQTTETTLIFTVKGVSTGNTKLTLVVRKEDVNEQTDKCEVSISVGS